MAVMVTRAFAGHAVGDVLTDDAAVLAGDNRFHVVRLPEAKKDEAAPAAKLEPEKPAPAEKPAPTLAEAIAAGVAAAEAELHPAPTP